jgi:hydroxyacylglutathione hydrolase
MFIKQLYTGCLSEAAYFIESNGEAAVIDPLRDVDVYLDLARERNARIKYIFETHFHADFVSGHLELQKATGADIIYGPGAAASFPVRHAADGEKIPLGNIHIEVMHTPGHTMESSCFLLRDATGRPHAVFTGDTLFIGDVGRPDLAQKGAELTSQDLAGILYDSLHARIIPLPDDVIVYPAHGPGSSCGKNLGPETFSTIGEQKKTNYALQPQTKEAFIKSVTDGLAAPPQYFPINAVINKKGYEELDTVLEKGMQPYTVAAFREKMNNDDVIVLDTRHASLFTQGFVPGSVFIGLEGRFAEWAGSLLPFDKEILLVTAPGMEKETVIRLARVGLDKTIGYLDGGFDAWKTAGEPIDLVIDVEPDELVMDMPHDPNMVILDVRRETEYADGHIKEAVNLPLSDLTDPGSMAHIQETQNLYLHCAGGYRSVIAASLMKRQGIHNLRNVLGGWSKLKEYAGKLDIVKENSVLN